MICNKCKRDIPDDSGFCQYCGNTIQKSSTPPKKQKPSTGVGTRILFITLFVILIAALAYTTYSYKQIQTELLDTQSALENIQSTLNSTKEKLSKAESDLSKANSNISDLKKVVEEYKSQVEYWKEKCLASDPDNVSYSYEFDSVTALWEAVKKAPSAYTNQNIKVVATVYKDKQGDIVIVDINDENLGLLDGSLKTLSFLSKNANIDVKIPNAFVESGDYIKLYGTVKISNGEIYLDNCQYDMISTVSERSK